MDYGMIGKIEKAKQYADERERVEFESFRVKLNGTNDAHVVEYDAGKWQCDCNFFSSRGVCGHTMAMERILVEMVQIGN